MKSCKFILRTFLKETFLFFFPSFDTFEVLAVFRPVKLFPLLFSFIKNLGGALNVFVVLFC